MPPSKPPLTPEELVALKGRMLEFGFNEDSLGIIDTAIKLTKENAKEEK